MMHPRRPTAVLAALTLGFSVGCSACHKDRCCAPPPPRVAAAPPCCPTPACPPPGCAVPAAPAVAVPAVPPPAVQANFPNPPPVSIPYRAAVPPAPVGYGQ